jgi:hypothetical protein
MPPLYIGVTEMVSGIMTNNPIPSVGYAIRASGGGKMSLPVAPSMVIYSHFRHVSGTPAPEGSRGVAINKLKILDVLIEQLSQIKRQGSGAITMEGQASEEQIDALIETYKTQIRQAKAASAAMPYLPSPSAQAGAVFSLVA